jgi:hypothetical protein
VASSARISFNALHQLAFSLCCTDIKSESNGGNHIEQPHPQITLNISVHQPSDQLLLEAAGSTCRPSQRLRAQLLILQLSLHISSSFKNLV